MYNLSILCLAWLLVLLMHEKKKRFTLNGKQMFVIQKAIEVGKEQEIICIQNGWNNKYGAGQADR